MNKTGKRNTKGMRRVAALIMAAVLACMVSPVKADITGLRTEPPELSVGQGQVETMLLWVDNVTNLVSFELHLSYDPEVIEVVDQVLDQPGIQVGAGDLAQYMKFTQNSVDTVQGTIDIAAVQKSGIHPVSGSGGLLVIPLRGISLGVSTVVYLDVGNLTVMMNGGQVAASFSWNPGMITIVQPKAVTSTPRATNTVVISAGPTATISSNGYPVSTSTGNDIGYPVSTPPGNATQVTFGYPPGTGAGLTVTPTPANGRRTPPPDSRLASPTASGPGSASRNTITVTPILGPARTSATLTPVPGRTESAAQASGTVTVLPSVANDTGQRPTQAPNAAQILVWVLVAAGVVGLAWAAGSFMVYRARHAGDDDLLL